MTFDPTITLGNVLTIATIATGGIALVMTMKADIAALRDRMDKVEQVVSKLTDALIQLARQEARLDSHADRLRQLENRSGD